PLPATFCLYGHRRARSRCLHGGASAVNQKLPISQNLRHLDIPCPPRVSPRPSPPTYVMLVSTRVATPIAAASTSTITPHPRHTGALLLRLLRERDYSSA